MRIKGILVVVFCALVSTIISISYNYLNIFYSANWWWSIIFFFVLFTTINLTYPEKANNNSDNEAIGGIIWLKLILLFAAIFTYSLVDKKGLIMFSAHFFSHYILFTVFEIRYLLSITKTRID